MILPKATHVRADLVLALHDGGQVHRLVLRDEHGGVADLELLGVGPHELGHGHVVLAAAALEHGQAELDGIDARDFGQVLDLLAIDVGGGGRLEELHRHDGGG